MNQCSGGQIVCISTRLVLASFYKDVVKEFTIDSPFYDLQDCSDVECSAVPGTERILYYELRPLKEPCYYNCYAVIGQEYVFNILCLPGQRRFTRELFFSALYTVCLPGQGPFELQAVVNPSVCHSCIISGDSFPRRFSGEQSGEQFAFAVGFNNALSSIYVGSPSTAVSGQQNTGKITAISALAREVSFTKLGSAEEDELGFSLDGSGDLNGDGWGDILAGAPSATIGSTPRAGYIRVLSGIDGSTLLELQNTKAEDQFGWSVSWVGDIDGDGIPDILVGAPQASPGAKTNAGSVLAFSGSTGSLIYRLDGQNPDDAFGYALAMLGDIDGDGMPDFAVGAPFASPSGRQQAGIVYVYSGASGSLLYAIAGGEAGAGLGFSLSSLDDINGDGIPEIIAGAPDSSPGGRTEAGSVYIFSGQDGSQLLHFAGPVSEEEVGISVSTLCDIDNDGLPDLLLGAPSANPGGKRFAGKVYLVSSKTGLVLSELAGETARAQFGWSVKGTGQPDAAFFLVGSPGNDTLYVYQVDFLKIYCEIKAAVVITITKNADILIPAFGAD